MVDCTLHIIHGEDGMELPCHQLSMYKSIVKDMIVMGTREHLNNLTSWLKHDHTRLWINPDVMLKPCEEGYKTEGIKKLARGVWIAWMRSTDPRCIWPDTNLYDALNAEPFETPLLQEWMGHLVQAMRPTYLKPLYGYHCEGEYLDLGMTPVQLDKTVCGLVKRKIIKI